MNSDEKKRLKIVILKLPYDCWGMISRFLGGFVELKALFFSVSGLYDYVSGQNSFCCKNMTFKMIDHPVTDKGQSYPHVKHIQIGDSKRVDSNRDGQTSMYIQKMKKRIRDANLSTLLQKTLGNFKHLESIQLHCRHLLKNKNTDSDRTIEVGRNVSNRYPNFKKLQISGFYDLTWNSSQKFSAFSLRLHSDIFPNLESVELANNSWRDDFLSRFDIFANNNQLPKLKELSIIGFCSHHYMDMDYLSFLKQHLRKLILKNCHPFYEHFSNFPNLEELKLVHIRSFSQKSDDRGFGFSKSKIENLPKLKTLLIESQEDDVEFIPKYPLKNIDFKTIGACLTTLTLHNVVTPPFVDGPGHREEQFPFEDLKKLKRLYLHLSVPPTHSTSIWGLSTRLLVLSPPQGDWTGVALESLRLDAHHSDIRIETTNNTDLSLKNLVIDTHRGSLRGSEISLNLEHFKTTLETLEIRKYKGGSLKSFGDSTERKIEGFQRLKKLVLENISLVGNREKECKIVRITNCPCLKKIVLQGYYYSQQVRKYRRIQHRFQGEIVVENLERLEKLHFEENASELTTIKNCPKITELSFDHCSKFCKGLTKTDLSRLTDLKILSCRQSILEDSSAFENGVIDGVVFRSLKYLEIAQSSGNSRKWGKWKIVNKCDPRKVFECDSSIHFCAPVRVLRNLENLVQIDIRTSIWQEIGVEEVRNIGSPLLEVKVTCEFGSIVPSGRQSIVRSFNGASFEANFTI